MAMQIAHQGSCLKPETRVFAHDLRFLSPCHRHGHTFSRYFIVNIKSIIMPSFSFIEADLAKRQLLIGVLDGTLKIGCSNSIEDISVHAIDMGTCHNVAQKNELKSTCGGRSAKL